MKVSEGDWAVTFNNACSSDEPEAQCGGGGFIVAGARCADLDVLTEGTEAARISFPFGAKC